MRPRIRPPTPPPQEEPKLAAPRIRPPSPSPPKQITPPIEEPTHQLQPPTDLTKLKETASPTTAPITSTPRKNSTNHSSRAYRIRNATSKHIQRRRTRHPPTTRRLTSPSTQNLAYLDRHIKRMLRIDRKATWGTPRFPAKYPPDNVVLRGSKPRTGKEKSHHPTPISPLKIEPQTSYNKEWNRWIDGPPSSKIPRMGPFNRSNLVLASCRGVSRMRI